MNKKMAGAALVIVALLASAIILHVTNTGTARPQPAAIAAMPAAADTNAAAQASTDAEADESEEVQYSQTLKGSDFVLNVSVNGNDIYRNVEVSLDDGKPILYMRTLDDQTSELANITFSQGDDFKLIKLIPGDAREQIVCEGSEYLSRGDGMLGTYSIYRIEGDKLQELFSVVTQRDRDADEGKPAQKLDAHIEQTTQDGKPAIIYHVTAGANPERAIVFVWDGKQFHDASGDYQKIRDEYRP